MAQVTSGVRSILSIAKIYNLFQSLVGGEQAQRDFITTYMQVRPVNRILDIGCGTARILDYLPENISYYGIDLSETYIKTAQKKYQHKKKVRFSSIAVSDFNPQDLEPFDIIIAIGVLHHLDDKEAKHLFRSAQKLLKAKGKIVTLDPCLLTKNQNPIAKFVINADRGKNVRQPEQYINLARNIFSNTQLHLRDNLLRIPYNHAILECRL